MDGFLGTIGRRLETLIFFLVTLDHCLETLSFKDIDQVSRFFHVISKSIRPEFSIAEYADAFKAEADRSILSEDSSLFTSLSEMLKTEADRCFPWRFCLIHKFE